MSGEREDISRRELLRGRFLGGFLDAFAGGVPSTKEQVAADQSHPRRACFPIFRPPGAIQEELFLENCTRCDACITACPHDAIVHAPARFRQAAGTPMIDAMRQPCLMCEDFPCITACAKEGSSVLRMDMPKTIGTARIDMQTCLAHQNSFCTVCSEHCPVDGAIELMHARPRIVEEKCTGCGICQHVCPAPENAVLLMPLRERSAPPPLNEDAA
jgi:ferredoxin-type protein NapG